MKCDVADENSECSVSVDNDAITCSLLPYIHQRVPSRHCQAWGQGHTPWSWPRPLMDQAAVFVTEATW